MSAADFEIVEICALRGQTPAMRLPAMGRTLQTEDYIALCVRPGRWLLLKKPSIAGRLKSLNGAPRAVPRTVSQGVPPNGALLSRAATEHVPHSPGKPHDKLNSHHDELAVTVDLSSALTVLRLREGATLERLKSACRLDLDPEVFQEGHAAATIIAQVSVILARLPHEMLVLTPATTARHFQEWLGEH